MELQDNQIRLSPSVENTSEILLQYPAGRHHKDHEFISEGLYIISSGILYPVQKNNVIDAIMDEFIDYGKDTDPITSHFISIENDYDPENNCFELVVKFQEIIETFTADYFGDNKEEFKYKLLTVKLSDNVL